MESFKIVSFVSILYTLWLSGCAVEGTEVKIMNCEVKNPMPGAAVLQEINIEDNKIKGSKLDVQQQINPSQLAAHLIIKNDNDDTMFEQNVDLCSMSTTDIFKNYFLAFEDPRFNNGECPLEPGSYSSSGFDIDIDDGPEGEYVGNIEILEGPNTIIDIKCVAKIE